MIFKRTIPRATVVALTLGGTPAATGCGDGGGHDPAVTLDEACNRFADCRELQGGGRDVFVQYCVEDWEYELSYYDARCGQTILRGLLCIGALPCSDLADGDLSECSAEVEAAATECEFDAFWW
jgi:hypothetical protein